MAYTTVNKSTDHFNTKLYSGTGSAVSITGVGFRPDLIWGKIRTGTNDHRWTDVVRGVGKEINSNDPRVEYSNNANGYIGSFDSDGFSISSGSSNVNNWNASGNDYVAWNWKAANSSGSANTDGTINSTVSANQTAGFSIVKWVGTGANGTIGHGLNAVPKMVIVKCLDAGVNWFVYHQATGNTKELYLDSNSAPYSGTTAWQSYTPTSSVVYLGAHNAGANKSGDDQIAYCFAEKTGFSKFGSYKGNGNADGTFVYLGFKPAFIITKKSSSTGPWDLFDNTRNVINPVNSRLHPSASDNEFTDAVMSIDFLSNGFKLKTTDNELNTNGATFIYMAFAEAPLVGSNNVPCTAR